jgi:hypothetical protein
MGISLIEWDCGKAAVPLKMKGLASSMTGNLRSPWPLVPDAPTTEPEPLKGLMFSTFPAELIPIRLARNIY